MKSFFTVASAATVAASSAATWTQVLDVAPWVTRGHFGASTTAKGSMLITGGMHVENNTHLNDVWRSTDGSVWEMLSAAAPWGERHRHGHLLFQDCVFIFGGTTHEGDDDIYYNDVWKSCDDGASWTQVTAAAQWSGREGFGFTVAGGKMLLIGGTTGGKEGAINEVWSTADGVNWSLQTNTPWEGRYSVTAVTTGTGDVLIAGGFGFNSTDGSNDVWSSSDVGATWTQRAAAAEWSPRVYVGLTTFNNITYLIGGQNGLTDGYLSQRDVWATEDGSKWAHVTDLPKPAAPARGGMGLLESANEVFVLGGSSEIFPHKDFNDVWTMSL